MKAKDGKPHVGIFGRRNVGKSSIINILADQEIAVVSDIAGTTTDPVKKSIEIPLVGAVVLVDTPGIDDIGELGSKRVEKSLQALKTIDAAILVIEGNLFQSEEARLVSEFRQYDVPFIVLHNKSDLSLLTDPVRKRIEQESGSQVLEFCAIETENRNMLFEALGNLIPETAYQSKSLLKGLVKPGDMVLLITPIDTEAPEGRMILPQIQVIRDVLDNDCIAILTKENEIESTIHRLKVKPVLAITDSQVFARANTAVPSDIFLTSFSIILARHKGDFRNYLKGTPHLAKLNDGDRILIMESCTHHVSCDDIGRIKLPGWISKYSGKKLEFDVVAGLNPPPRSITGYTMVIQCGGCMITRKQIINRLKEAVDLGIPVSNYGMTIAWLHGIYQRVVAPFASEEYHSL